MRNQTQTQANAVVAINNSKLQNNLANVSFAKTFSQTYSNLGADVSSGDAIAKSIYLTLLQNGHKAQQASDFKGNMFDYISTDIDITLDGVKYDLMIVTTRSIHLGIGGSLDLF